MALAEKLSRHEPVSILELRPNDPNMLQVVSKIKQRVDAVRLTALKNSGDPGNLGRTAEEVCVESAIRLTHASGIDVMASLVCRDHPRDDKNVLLRLWDTHVRSLLVLYGDPNDPPRPNHYNFKSAAELILWIRGRESTIDERKRTFLLAVGSDPTAEDVGKQVSGLAEKVSVGANIAITQPIFDAGQGLRFLGAVRAEGIDVPILIGLLALKSSKSAEFLEKRIGVRVPSSVKERMEGKGDEEGLRIATEVYSSLADKVQGFYVYPWVDANLDTALSLLDRLGI